MYTNYKSKYIIKNVNILSYKLSMIIYHYNNIFISRSNMLLLVAILMETINRYMDIGIVQSYYLISM